MGFGTPPEDDRGAPTRPQDARPTTAPPHTTPLADLPASAGSVEAAPRDEKAQIGPAILDELQPGIAAPEQHELDDPV